MKNRKTKEMCLNRSDDYVQQTLPGRLTGRARDFDSRRVGSNPTPATNGAVA